ncbi:MAG: hypothetical protein WCR42_15865, partial [bacterium]
SYSTASRLSYTLVIGFSIRIQPLRGCSSRFIRFFYSYSTASRLSYTLVIGFSIHIQPLRGW